MKPVTGCLGLPLAVYSVLVTSVATLTNACPAYDYYSNPLLDLNVPALLRGDGCPLSRRSGSRRRRATTDDVCEEQFRRMKSPGPERLSRPKCPPDERNVRQAKAIALAWTAIAAENSPIPASGPATVYGLRGMASGAMKHQLLCENLTGDVNMRQQETISKPHVSSDTGRLGYTERWFIYSAAVILLLTAAAKLLSATGQVRALDAHDPLLMLSYRSVFILVGALECAVAACLILSRRNVFKLQNIAWLSNSFLVYRLGLLWMGVTMPCGCLGTLTAALGISPRIADFWMKVVLAYLLFGSAVFLVARMLASSAHSRLDGFAGMHRSTLLIPGLTLGFLAGLPQTVAAPVAFEIAVLLEYVHPQVPYQRYDFQYAVALDLATGRWVIADHDTGDRIFFDGVDTIQITSTQRPTSDGSLVSATTAVVHCQHEQIPISLDREHLAAWFAYAAKPALIANEGKAFPNLHGQYIYDINSHCCVVNPEWAEPNAIAPSRAVFYYNREAIEATRRFLSDEEIASDPLEQEALRENYLSLAEEGQIGGEFVVMEWLPADGAVFPKSWVYEVKLLGQPSLRFSGNLLEKVSPMVEDAFGRMLAYDATVFDSITDFRFLALPGLDKIRYTPRQANSASILPTNHTFFDTLVAAKVHDTRLRHREAENLRSPKRHVVWLALLAVLLVPVVIWIRSYTIRLHARE